MKRIIGMIIFLAAILLFIGVMGLTAEATITVDNGAETITLTTDEYTLDEVWAADNVGNDNLTNLTNDIWRLNYSLIVDSGSLLLNPSDGCIWLRLGVNNTAKHNANITVQGTGRIYVNDTMITGWNNTADANLTWNSSFRPYIYVHSTGSASPQPNATFNNSAIGYLGWNRDNQYGIVYECGDISGRYEPAGWMHNCTIMENYIGITFQGVTNMNVTNTWMNNTHEVGIVYTIDQVLGHGSNDGYIGDHTIWPHNATYDSVAVDYCSGADDAMGIRLYGSDNITLNEVNIQDANTTGLRIDTCDNVDADAVTSYLNTEAASDYNIYLTTVTNSHFDNCTAFSPEGTIDGGNWILTGTSYSNNFTTCWGFNSSGQEDFNIDTDTHNNTFTDCTANNSNYGFYCLGDNYNRFINCVSHNHTLCDYKFYGSQHNTITNGYANDSAVGVYIYDDASWNGVTGLNVNRQSSYGVQIGDTDDISHNISIESVTVTGTTTGDGIFVLGNCTHNYIGNSSVIDLTPITSGGMGVADWGSYNMFYNCDVNSSGGHGFYFLENASHNIVNYCTADDNRHGIRLTNYTNNNSINNSVFSDSLWNGIWVDAETPSPGNNAFWHSSCNGNANGISITDSPLVRFTEVNAYNNSLYGVVVDNDALAYFFDCISYTATWGDWYIGDTTDVDIYNQYILGFDRNINFQIDTVQPYGLCAHDPGDGLWQLNTQRMTVHCNDGKDVMVNLTDWTGATYRKWIVTGVTGDYVYQKIGGLTSGILYDLFVNGQVVGTYTGQTVSMLGADTAIVWFNYTGGWSTKYFEIKPHVDAADTTGAAGTSDTATITTTPTPRVSTNTIVTALAILFCLSLICVALWFYYKK